VNYFKRQYKWQPIPGMWDYCKRSSLYNHKMDKFLKSIETDTSLFKEKYWASVEKATSTFTIEKRVNVSSSTYNYAINRLVSNCINLRTDLQIPSADDVLQAVNWKASIGMSRPWIRKRDVYASCYDIIDGFINGTLNIQQILHSDERLAAAFKRLQITEKGLKHRLVFAINYKIVVIEKYFDVLWKQVLIKHGGIVTGYTQPEISKTVSLHAEMFSYSFDAKGFDHTLPQFLIVTSYTILEKLFCHNEYMAKCLRFLRNVLLTMVLFHPDLNFNTRLRGLNSGSGLTNTVGSIVMYLAHSMCIFEYFKLKGLSVYKVATLITVSSDDSILSSEVELDVALYINLFNSLFGIDLELEHVSPPGVDETVFLGSRWLQGKPVRSIHRMFGRIIFGTGNYPRMNTEQLFCSRAFEILGNDSRFDRIWETFNLEMPDRLFRFVEVADYQTQLEIKAKLELQNSSESRGVWESIRAYKIAGLARVWETR